MDKVREAMLLHLDVIERFIKNSLACDISNEMGNIRNLKYLINKDNWQPIETKPPFTPCYEKGEYRTDDGVLYYFKPTHWQPLPEPPKKVQL